MRLRPDYVPPRLAMAQIDLSKGDFSRSLQGATEILAIEPSNLAAKLIRSSSLIGMGDKIKAREELEQTLKAQPNSRDAHFQIAMLDFSDRQFRPAEETFRKLDQMTPPDPRGLLGLVEVYVAQGQFDTAIKLIESDLKATPDKHELRLYLANTAVRAQRFEMAISNYKFLLEVPEAGRHLRAVGETIAARQLKAPRVTKRREINPADPVSHSNWPC
jgi:tetratricopeptide (TPR) repeat protein